MSQSADLHPTHLSAFLLEQATGLPIRGLPCYAEVSMIVAPEPAGEPDRRFDDLISNVLRQRDSVCAGDTECQQRVLTALSTIISRRLPSGARDRLLENVEEARQLFGEIVARALNLAGAHTFNDLSSTALADALDQAIQQVAEARHLALREQPVESQSPTWTHPLGIVASDHAGYLSFDLLRLPPDVHQAVAAAIQARRLHPGAPAGVSLWVYPLLRTAWRVDALAQNRFTPDAILARLDLNPQDIPDLFKDMGLLAMQSPSLTDWQLSPASFAANPRALLGEDGCETLLPANLALQEFFFYQVVRLNDVLPEVPDALRETVKLGVVHEYRLAWYALGHSLGQILYSLPLAPGESVNLAVIDWTRRDDAQRKEQTHVDEQLIHNEHRDRTITETVDAAVKEYQHGSSFLGGLAGSAGVSAAVSSSVGLAGGLAGSLGGSTASSDGSRNLTATTVQKISDNITQASSAMRELQSTVVVQSVQAEKEAIETRTVVNYNHSHALTILYYEVLRHFRIVTELAGHRPAVLVRIRTNWFDGEEAGKTILENRAALEGALLDPKYSEGFNALQRIAHREQLAKVSASTPAPVPAYTGDRKFLYYTFAMTTAEYFSSNKQSTTIQAGFLYNNGPGIRLFNPGDTNPEHLNQPGAFRAENQTNTFTATNPPASTPPEWKQVTGMLIDIHVDGGSDSQVSFKHIKVTARDQNGNDTVLVDQGYDDGHLVISESTTITLPTRQPEPLPPPAPRPAEEIEDDAKKAELLAHLQYHKAHYSRAMLLNQNATDRALELSTHNISGNSTVLDCIENRPLELIGEYLAYPCTDPGWTSAILQAVQRTQRVQLASSPLDERLITLPTRGVFAEAKLGHCNASEEIDNTRFWDWQQSPIPHLAPEIAPVTPVTPAPHDPNLQPTPFPTSLVNIVNPPAAPDPTGMAAALNVLATPNIFRDMSGRAEVADLLKKLSDNSISIAQAATQARSIQAKYGDPSAPGSSSGGASGSGANAGFGARATPTQPSAATRDLQDLRKELGQGVANKLTSPDKARAIYEAAADRVTSGPMLGFAFDEGAHGADGGAGGSSSITPTLDPGNFKRFVDEGRLDPELADVLRALDTRYPADSWAKQTAAFTYHELEVGNLFALMKESSREKVRPLLPEGFKDRADQANSPVPPGGATTVDSIGHTGAYKGFTLISDEMVVKGMTPGPEREFLALVITHEMTHFRNRDYRIEFLGKSPSEISDFYIDATKANSYPGTQSIADKIIWEVFCDHVAWRVLQDLRHLSAGTPIPDHPDEAGFFRYALGINGKKWPDNGYTLDLSTTGQYNQQIALWLLKMSSHALFHDDPAKNRAIRQFIQDMYDFAKPDFLTPAVPPDGGA